MTSIDRSEIQPIKMASNPPDAVVNAGMRVINTHDNYIYEYVGFTWVQLRLAEREDYAEIPQLI